MAMNQKKRKKQKLTTGERIKRCEREKFKKEINKVFINSSFVQIPTRNHNIEVNGREGEIDNIFMYENLLILVEDTMTSDTDKLKAHVQKTASFLEHIKLNSYEFIEALKKEFPKFRETKKSGYIPSDYKIVGVYCSKKRLDSKYQKRFPFMKYMEYPFLQYFLRLSRAIKQSSKYELFKFLGLLLSDIGHQESGDDYRRYEGFLLPESPSGFPQGFKIVSFLIEPQRLMEQCYVLRKDGWLDTDCLYQRLLIKNKIVNMRKYLIEEKRVFVNNIIVTLPDDTKLHNDEGLISDESKLNIKQKVKIELRKELNTIGIIDGQHRVFTYHEGYDKADMYISDLRKKQHLLVTGIIYPPNTKPENKTKFEAKLFLEINDKQSRTKGDLKQAIESLVNPYSSTAIAKKVIVQLGQTGVLTGYLEEHFYDKGKIKTTSIVSYGMKHIVKIDGEFSLFAMWKHDEKDDIVNKKNKIMLDEYVTFCEKEINKFIGAFKANIDNELWTHDKKISAALRTTTINGMIFCIRKLIENNKLGSYDTYKKKLAKFNIDFKPANFKYKSSHWKELGDDIYRQCFA